MPISGTIPITLGQGVVPGSSWFAVGASDGVAYTVSGEAGAGFNITKVGSTQTLTTVYTRTIQQLVADFNALALPGVPVWDWTDFTHQQAPIPIPGTAYFYQGGQITGDWVVAVRYKVMNSSSVLVDGGWAYAQNSAPGTLEDGWCFGSAVVDGELFAVCWCWGSLVGTYLLRLPLDFGGTFVELDPAEWLSRATYVGGASQFKDVLNVATYFNAPIYENICTILKHPASLTSVLILTYRCKSSLPGSSSNLLTAGSEGVIVDYDTQSVGNLTSWQSELGQPWPDDGQKFNGSASPEVNDCYCGPTVNDGTGASAREVWFGRNFTDAGTIGRCRRYIWNEVTGTFTPVDVVDFTIATGLGTELGTIVYRFDPDTVYAAKYTVGVWRIGEFELGLAGEPRRWLAESGPIRSIA